jgi:hypothetical protein
MASVAESQCPIKIHASATPCAELSGGGPEAPAGDDYEASPPQTDAAAWRRRAAACAGALATHHARQAPGLETHPAVQSVGRPAVLCSADTSR